MKDEMRRGRSQVIWRYSPGATYRYNESGGWCTTTSVTLRDPAALQGALAKAVAQMLRRWNAIGPIGFPDPELQGTKYSVGEPYQVNYSVWPTVFTCRRCGRVHFYKELSKLRQVNDWLACLSCKSRDLFKQVPYAYVCECGRLDSISMQKHDYTHPIELIDRGSFQESYWYCKLCKIPLYRTPKEGLGFRRCECAPRKGKRGILLEDSRVYYSQTIDLVEIEPKTLDRWKDNSRFSDLLLGACLYISSYRPSHILDLAKWKASGPDLSPDLKEMLALLLKTNIDKAQAEEMVKQAAKKTSTDPWIAYDEELGPLRSMIGPYVWKDSRRTVEYIFVRDEPSADAIPLDNLIDEARESGDFLSEQRYQEEKQLASTLGLINLRVVQALPILLAGVGYSRYSANPKDPSDEITVNLRPYAPQDGKIPIYVARNTTEGMLYELDPWRMAAFLSINSASKVPAEATRSEISLRAWLLGQSARLVEKGESHFELRSYELETGLTVDEPSALMFGVLHTLSHVLKATAHRYVGIDADSLAEYLFPMHLGGLLYASLHFEFTLGGIDSVFRTNLNQWLGSARDYAGLCSFDPICAESGGACLACLYPKFGCAYFNRTVSRSFLLGGQISGRDRPLHGFWTLPVIEEANRLRGK